MTWDHWLFESKLAGLILSNTTGYSASSVERTPSLLSIRVVTRTETCFSSAMSFGSGRGIAEIFKVDIKAKGKQNRTDLLSSAPGKLCGFLAPTKLPL